MLLVALHSSLPTVYPSEQALIWAAGQTVDPLRPPDADACGDDLRARRELVLLHDHRGAVALDRPPRLTRRWLDPRPGIALHHHVRLAVPGDTARVARHLAGRSVGLVLGGGGARGLAHMGVLQACEELGIPVDFVGGTSQGAFMAAAYAQTLSTQGMDRAVRELSDGMGSTFALLRDLTLPVFSTFSGKNFSATIRSALGSGDILDTWIPFFCVSTCVSSHTNRGDAARVHRRGPLWRYVRASMTLVGYLPPVYDNGELLVDGGYCNNLPSDVMQRVGAAAIIGVDVENRSGQAPVMPLGESVSGWWVLWRRMLEALGLGGDSRLPSQGDLTVTLCYIAHNNQLAASRAGLDLYVQPPVDGYGLLDYHKRDEIVAKAYVHAYEALRGFEHPRDVAARRERATTNAGPARANPQSVGDGEIPPVQSRSTWTACVAGVAKRVGPRFSQTRFQDDMLSSDHYASD